MRYFSSFVILMILATTGTAMAASLENRFGINGKLGAFVPLQDDFVSGASDSKSGVIAGGGFIFGFSSNVAGELDVLHVPELDLEISGSKAYEASFTDVALGLQYRLASQNRLVPFFGAGVDFIKGNLEHVSGAKYDLEWTVGGHLNAGLDYFINNGIAFTVDVRGLLAAKGDVESGGIKVGEYDPMSFIGTLGIRLILPEKAFW